MQLAKAARVILVGAPGVGKGTQAGRLLKRYGQLSAITSGDLLRDNVRNKTPLGIQAQRLMKEGALVPDAMILRLIRNELIIRGWLKPVPGHESTVLFGGSSQSQAVVDNSINAQVTPTNHPNASYILDGFPRTASQAEQLDELVPVNMVAHLHTPRDIILDRIANRWVHAPSGRVYNTTFNPPVVPGKDDVTGEPLTRREDDSEEVWTRRLRDFEEASEPLLEHYDRVGLLWKVQGNSSDEISPKLFAEFERSAESTDDAFDPPPVPAKRRRISSTSTENVAAPRKRGRPAKSKSEKSVPDSAQKPVKGDPKAKKPKHRIIIHEKPQPLWDEEDAFTQTAQDSLLSSQPWQLRGPKWSKPIESPVVSVQRNVLEQPPGARDVSPARKPDRSTQLDAEVGDEDASEKPRVDTDPGNTVADHTESGAESDVEALAASDEEHLLPTRSPPAAPIINQKFAAELADLPSDAFENFDVEKELADLPSDAFASSSSSPQKSPRRIENGEPIMLSSQISSNGVPNLAAPRNASVQMNLFGQIAKDQPKSDASNKRYNWPAPEKEEPPTHHELDAQTLHSWIYPTNIGSIRDYQYNIVQRGLFNNLLVALPTGLGKTFIAATVMLNWYRWTKNAQIVFVAPTKPLVAQQVEACFGIAGIPRSETTMLTGGISPGLRAEEWLTKRVFFTTPQTVHHDFQSGIADPKKLVLLVVDEAHRATGNYAYVQLVRFVRRFNPSFRVLALTATPGNSVEAVQEVINGLDIARVEIRTETSLDIRQYVHQRKTDRKIFSNSAEMDMIMDWFGKALQPVINILVGQNAYWERDPLKITPFGLTQGRNKWNASETGRRAHMGTKAQVNRIFTVLASLAHSLELLKYHGLGPFFHTMKAFQNKILMAKGGSKYESMINDNENFQKMMTRLQFWINNPDFVGHPKLEYLQNLVLEHFSNTSELQEVNAEGNPPRETRIMIFAHFRDSAEEICRVLRRDQPMIRPHVFVGQSSSKGSEGMDQKKQQEIIGKFKDGTYNTLIATSIGEEGLDIGEVDLIVCYDSSASPIRMLQRMGRTGRKRAGAIVLLLMRGKEEESFIRAKDNYEKMQSMISLGDRFDFHDDKSPRILPRGCNPEPERRHVEIPVENTQAALPEPTEKGRKAPKKPPKKFHMPDNVKTGFVKASRINASESDSDDIGASKADLAPIPTHASVKLSPKSFKDFEKNYLRAHGDDDDVNVMMPSADQYTGALRDLQRTKLVRHGQVTIDRVNMVSRMHAINTETIDDWDRTAGNLDINALCGPERAISQPSLSSIIPDKPTSSNTKSKPAPKRGRPAKAANTTNAAPKKTTKRAPPAAKQTPQTKKSTKRSFSYAETLASMDAPPSSPPATDPRLALPTQGIDLGSQDTSGDDFDEYADSSLRAFVVNSDEIVRDGDDESHSGSGSGISSEDDDEVMTRSIKRSRGRGQKRGRGQDSGSEDDASSDEHGKESDQGSDRSGDENEEDERSAGSDNSLPDVDALLRSQPALPSTSKTRQSGKVAQKGDISPASKRLSQRMQTTATKAKAKAKVKTRKKRRVVESESEDSE
ncbi:MAG: hypothetical protein Q9159_000064 [Coniocarpon cinnabarinum]